jgi:hypothetical protein
MTPNLNFMEKQKTFLVLCLMQYVGHGYTKFFCCFSEIQIELGILYLSGNPSKYKQIYHPRHYYAKMLASICAQTFM